MTNAIIETGLSCKARGQTPYSRFGDRLQGDWGVFFNILNIEAQTGITDDRFATLVLGMP